MSDKTRLVIGMKAKDRVAIGEKIEVEIDRISEFKIDVAIYAPRDVKILRQGLRKYDDAKGNAHVRPTGRRS
jgi:sRNA-binding carbon storage regulator CsrA